MSFVKWIKVRLVVLCFQSLLQETHVEKNEPKDNLNNIREVLTNDQKEKNMESFFWLSSRLSETSWGLYHTHARISLKTKGVDNLFSCSIWGTQRLHIKQHLWYNAGFVRWEEKDAGMWGEGVLQTEMEKATKWHETRHIYSKYSILTILVYRFSQKKTHKSVIRFPLIKL